MFEKLEITKIKYLWLFLKDIFGVFFVWFVKNCRITVTLQMLQILNPIL